MEQQILILNGPNLNMLGIRDPDIYGTESLRCIHDACKKKASELGDSIEFRQTNDEGELVKWIQTAPNEYSGIILNAGAYSHTSIAILDALGSVNIPTIEVHLSNIYSREEYRRHSFVSEKAIGVICGLGSHGYTLALDALSKILREG